MPDDDLDPDVEQCVLSMKEDNPDMDESTMVAVCTDMQNKGALETYLDAEPDDGAALAQFRNPGDIQRVEKDGNVVYKRVMLLSPGVWTDAGSEQTVDYTAEGIRASAENWVDMDAVRKEIPEWQRLSNEQRAERIEDLGDRVLTDEVAVNFLHGPSMYGADSLDEVAHIPTESIIVDDQGRLYADLVMHGDSAQSVTTIELMDEVLEAANTPGMHTPPVGPSVEIPADRVDRANGVMELQEAWFSGAGVVFNPASRPVELGVQAAERAVAMTAADGDSGGLVYRDSPPASDQTLKAALRQRWRMGDDADPTTDLPDFEEMNDEELARTLEAMNEDFEELKRTLQGEEELVAVLDAVQEFDAAGEDLSQGADAFRAWAAENTDLDEGLLDDVLGAYLQAVDAEDLSETPVEALQQWLNEMAGEAPDEEPDDEPADDEPNMEDLEAVKETLGQFADHMSDIKDMLQATQEDQADRLEELERRLSSIEDEPSDDRALSGKRPDNFLPSDEPDETEEQTEAAGPGAPSI